MKIAIAYNGSPTSSGSSPGLPKKLAVLNEKGKEPKRIPRVKITNTDMLIDDRSNESPFMKKLKKPHSSYQVNKAVN